MVAIPSKTKPNVSDGELLAADITRICADLKFAGLQVAWAYCAAVVIICVEALYGKNEMPRTIPAALLIAASALARFWVCLKLGRWSNPTWLRMASSIAGLILLSEAPGFDAILLSVGLIAVGSAIFHPEASRIARMASGGRHGLRNRCSRLAAPADRRYAGSGPDRGCAIIVRSN
jgi:hypothetical protein